MKDYYKVLGVRQDASCDEIKKAYRNLARKFHPDTHRENKKFYEEKMKDLNEASHILTNNRRRADYDHLLKAEREKRLHDFAERQRAARANVVYAPPPSRPYKPPPKQTASPSQKSAGELTNSIKILTLVFIGQAITAVIVISICLYFFFIKPANENKFKPTHLDFGMSKADVIELLGQPTNETKHLLIYDGFQIIIQLGKVDGWLDASGELPVGHQEKLYPNDIRVGQKIETIISHYGNPDTYSPELAIYETTVLYLENGKVTAIETVK